MEDIQETTNKAWGLGNDRFKAKVEQLMDRQVQAKPRGSDRKPEVFKKKCNINQTLTPNTASSQYNDLLINNLCIFI